VDNRISVNVNFKEAISFEDAVQRTYTLIKYLGMLVGRPQNLLEMRVRLRSDAAIPILLEAYWSMIDKRDSAERETKPLEFSRRISEFNCCSLWACPFTSGPLRLEWYPTCLKVPALFGSRP
jgi:hypothetical protein